MRQTDKPNKKVTMIVSSFVVGIADGREFEAKVQNDPSDRGIDYGRVVKLIIYHPKLPCEILKYNNGWIKYPARKYENLLDMLLEQLERLPPAGQNAFTDTKEKER